MSDPQFDLKPDVRSDALGLVPGVTSLPIAVPKVGVASVPIRSAALKVRSFYFPQSGNWREKFLAAQNADKPAP